MESHIARQSRARKEKLDMTDKLKVSGYVKQQQQLLSGGAGGHGRVSDTSPFRRPPAPHAADSRETSSASRHSLPTAPPVLPAAAAEANRLNASMVNISLVADAGGVENHTNHTMPPMTGGTGPGAPIAIVELLERERREWQTERLKLIHCIHLQQLELSQRATAAQERATEIAIEFAKVIEGFEQRLVTMETNVQKEIGSLKSIAESIKSSVSQSR